MASGVYDVEEGEFCLGDEAEVRVVRGAADRGRSGGARAGGEVSHGVNQEGVDLVSVVEVRRNRPLVVPPVNHNFKRTFVSWNMKRAHGQKSVYNKLALKYDDDVLEHKVKPVDIGQLTEMECPHCHALYYFVESAKDKGYRECCHRGKISMEPFRRPTEEAIYELYAGTSPNAVHFRTNLRAYNNLLSLGTVVADWETGTGRGPSVLRINGQIQHFINCSDPSASRTRRDRDQIYFTEIIDESVDARLERARLFSLAPNRDVLRLVETYIRRENPYAQSYRMLKEVLANVHDRDVTDVVLAINPVQRGQWARRTVPLEHRYYGDRCEVAATTSVAAVFVGEVPPVSYDVRVQMRRESNNQRFHPQFEQDRILFNCQSVDPLCYTLLHIHGEPAWGGSVSR